MVHEAFPSNLALYPDSRQAARNGNPFLLEMETIRFFWNRVFESNICI